jgi:hypothetical protein
MTKRMTNEITREKKSHHDDGNKTWGTENEA